MNSPFLQLDVTSVFSSFVNRTDRFYCYDVTAVLSVQKIVICVLEVVSRSFVPDNFVPDIFAPTQFYSGEILFLAFLFPVYIFVPITHFCSRTILLNCLGIKLPGNKMFGNKNVRRKLVGNKIVEQKQREQKCWEQSFGEPLKAEQPQLYKNIVCVL